MASIGVPACTIEDAGTEPGTDEALREVSDLGDHAIATSRSR